MDEDIRQYYESFGILKPKQTKKLKGELIHNLFQRPPPEKGVNMPRYQVFKEGAFQQADLLFLPNDGGYKYALVVVDGASRHCDAEPLKGKTPNEIVKAFRTIWDTRKIIPKPVKGVLEVDAGTEFRGALLPYLKSQNIGIRVAKPQRHRQQALVERKNFSIAKALFHRMISQELITGETSREWISDIATVVKLLNLKAGKFTPPKTHNEDPVASGDSTKLLDIGTKVRVKLDAPKEAVGEDLKHLSGKFRATDIRWDPKIRTVNDIILKPGFPPMYLLDGDMTDKKLEMVGYTKPQLQIVQEPQNDPPGKIVVRGQPDTYVVKKILDRRIKSNKYEYLIQWRGFDDQTWEPRESLLRTVAQTVERFDQDFDAQHPNQVIKKQIRRARKVN